MTPEIRPLHPDDLDELGRFLTEGFHAPLGADFAAPDVLRWKYLEPIGGNSVPRSFVACEGGRIIGHVGACPTAFRGPGLPSGGVSTVHIIDWLGSRERRAVGLSLMRHAHGTLETQYGLIASDQGHRVSQAAGYVPTAEVPVFHKVLRVGYRWSLPGHGPAGRLARVAKDAARKMRSPGNSPKVRVETRHVEEFGPEVLPILEDVQRRAILTAREPVQLNHVLRFPRPGMSGWLIHREGRTLGFALLNVKESTRTGKLVECLLEGEDVDLWHAAVVALAKELNKQGVGAAIGFGSTPWMSEALRRSGFAETNRFQFTLRDRQGRIPRGVPFHLSPFEADYAYL